jgi:topoisomerase-4 subunit A
MLMETLFRFTQLESRFPLNMNVLTADRVPQVLGLRAVIQAWLDHRHEVLIRVSRHRQAAIERRLEILDGYLAVFLNLDEVIRIIREEDEPKPALIKRFELTDIQAEAILNMRLRSLRRLEELELRKEHKNLSKELKDLKALLSDDRQRWKRIAAELEKTRETFGRAPLGTRRTVLGTPPSSFVVSTEAFVEREAITIILSDKGWVRAVRGAVANPAEMKFKEGDKLRILLPCETTDRLCLFATNGKAYTIRAAELPRGRGDGQAIRLLAEMTNEDDVAALFIWRPEIRYLVASTTGRGFLVAADDLLAEKRTGKQILNLKPGEEARLCLPAIGDHVAIIGENRKLLVFPLDQVPELARGAGVILQRYSGGGLSDAQVFTMSAGLSWKLGDKQRTEANLRDWLGERAQAGRMPPNGFPRSNRFSG